MERKPEGLQSLLTRLQEAERPEPALMRNFADFLRGRLHADARRLKLAEQEAPWHHRQIEALRIGQEDLHDELEDLTTGEVELSVFAAHLRLHQRKEAEFLTGLYYEDIGEGD